MKKLINSVLNVFGLELRRINRNAPQTGSMHDVLYHLKARGLKCDVIMDIGANSGTWSVIAKQIFPKAKCYLFEAQVEMEEKLKSFCEKHLNSSYFMQALGATSEKRTFTIWEDLQGSSFLPNGKVETKEQRHLSIVSLDEFIIREKLEIPDLIKLDTQGFELEILKGAESIMGKTEVIILETSLIEFDDLPDLPLIAEVIDFMNSKGYAVYDFAGFLRRPLDLALGQCDICFVRKDSHLRSNKRWMN
jgi:FkbM family methyltransferase